MYNDNELFPDEFEPDFAVFDDACEPTGSNINSLPKSYTMRPDGLYYQPATVAGEEEKDAIRLCQPFDIVARCTDENGENPGTLIKWVDRDGRDHEFVVRDIMAHTEKNALVQALVHCNLHCEIGAEVSNALKRFFAWLQPTQTIIAFDRAGWQNDGKLFLMANGDAIGQSLAIFTGRNKNKNRRIGDLDQWQSNVAAKAVGNSRLIMALSAAFVGPLIDICGEEFSAFHFVGSSSIGKSTAAVFAASVWGEPTQRDQLHSWRATDNGLEGVAAECTDTILVLDEMGQVDPRVIGECVYMLANGAGKARASRDGAAREVRHWRLSVISTGELTVEGALKAVGKHTPGGIDVRMINIPAEAGAGMGMFEDTHGSSPKAFADGIKAMARRHYGTAGASFVQALCELRETPEGLESLQQYLDDRMRKFSTRYMPANADTQCGRVIQKFALAAAAGELAAEMNVLPWAEGVATSGVAACVAGWLAARGSIRPKEERDVIAKVRDFITAHGDSRFEKSTTRKDSDSSDSHVVRDRAGWISSTGSYLFATGAFEKLVAPMSPWEAAKVLADDQYLKIGSPKGNGKPVYSINHKIGGVSTRVYAVLPAILEGD